MTLNKSVGLSSLVFSSIKQESHGLQPPSEAVRVKRDDSQQGPDLQDPNKCKALLGLCQETPALKYTPQSRDWIPKQLKKGPKNKAFLSPSSLLKAGPQQRVCCKPSALVSNGRMRAALGGTQHVPRPHTMSQKSCFQSYRISASCHCHSCQPLTAFGKEMGDSSVS